MEGEKNVKTPTKCPRIGRIELSLEIDKRVNEKLIGYEISRRERTGAFLDGFIIAVSVCFIIYWFYPMLTDKTKI
jgi:hypothetical protein